MLGIAKYPKKVESSRDGGVVLGFVMETLQHTYVLVVPGFGRRWTRRWGLIAEDMSIFNLTFGFSAARMVILGLGPWVLFY